MGLIAIGDIHGCARTLEVLLRRLAPTPDDHLVFIGDYIDRGPNSKGVIDQLLLLERQVQCTFLRGNHEALMLDYMDNGHFDLWRVNGGIATLNSYPHEANRFSIPGSHIAFIRRTKPYHDEPGFFFVHAGLLPDRPIRQNLIECDERVFLWERSHLQAEKVAWEKPVVCGHTPVQEPTNKEYLINIDTGCVYNMHPGLGKLTAVRLPEREFVMVDYVG